MDKINISISDEIKTLYDQYYEGESEWRWLGAIDKCNNVVALCSSMSPKSILEIGYGEGSILKRLSDLNFGDALYSLEISSIAVDIILKRNIKSLVECKLFDGYNIPYEDKKFDLAILSHVVEHLEYPRRMLYEASRVAKYVFVEVPLEDNIRLKKDFLPDGVGHINYYSLKTIRRLVQTCSLEVLSQIVTNLSYRIYKYKSRKKGFIKYIIKEMGLRIIPSLATKIWTYHCSLLCSKKLNNDTSQELHPLT